ncbi:hypothetical protein B296_00000077 [Ensete ventricosum]|uniref:Uncharacterized protein n=1 Tax=Ensete ventricosum TaxID=4639 RepID=A0A427B5Z8_ENSVE|nr:hypothetical protein B296_00000077 [Ensete ventricosum]
MALAAALTAEDQEVLAYLLSGGGGRWREQRRRRAHPPELECGCFGCYKSFWARWDASPNRHVIHRIIDAVEESLEARECDRGEGGRRRRRSGRGGNKGANLAPNATAVALECQKRRKQSRAMGRHGDAGADARPLLTSESYARCPSRRDDDLRNFRSCLRWLCLDQSGSRYRAAVSWAVFLLLAVAVPAVSHFVLAFRPERRPYDLVVQLSLTAASALSFLTLSSVTRSYGLRRFLFLDKLPGETDRVRLGYTFELNQSFRLLSCFVAPCFATEVAYKLWWYISGAGRIPFVGNPLLSYCVSCALQLASLIYRISSFFLSCVLFRLICYLQILRLEDFAAVFRGDSEVEAVLREHLRLRRQLKVISHRFRVFILTGLVMVTASQFAATLVTLRPHSDDNLFNTGELAVSLPTPHFASSNYAF